MPEPSELQTEGLHEGVRVNWLYRPRGGYCQPMSVAAVVSRMGPAFVQVRIAVRNPITDRWHPEYRWVHPSHLSLRTLRVPPVDEAFH